MSTPTIGQIVRKACEAYDIDGLDYVITYDYYETYTLTVGDEFFAIGEDTDDDGAEGYSWGWGAHVDGEVEHYGEDGGTTTNEAAYAIADWLDGHS